MVRIQRLCAKRALQGPVAVAPVEAVDLVLGQIYGENTHDAMFGRLDPDLLGHASTSRGRARRLRAKRSIAAMRTATPISTCSWITLRLMSSAISPSISTPRFIGPGCMTMASGLA